MLAIAVTGVELHVELDRRVLRVKVDVLNEVVVGREGEGSGSVQEVVLLRTVCQCLRMAGRGAVGASCVPDPGAKLCGFGGNSAADEVLGTIRIVLGTAVTRQRAGRTATNRGGGRTGSRSGREQPTGDAGDLDRSGVCLLVGGTNVGDDKGGIGVTACHRRADAGQRRANTCQAHPSDESCAHRRRRDDSDARRGHEDDGHRRGRHGGDGDER